MEKEKFLFDFMLDPRDDDMEIEDDVGCLLSNDGEEGTSKHVVVEIESIDDVTFEAEDKDPIEQVENENMKTKFSPKGKTPKKLKEYRETHELSKRQRAPCWDHFDDFMKDGIKWARCKYCGKEYVAYSKKHGVTNLNAHTPVCLMYPNRDRDGQSNLTFQCKGDGVEVVSSVFPQADYKRALAEMIIIDELPFRFVEGVGFRRFCEVMQPKFENVSRQTITREVGAINKIEKLKLKK